MVRNERTISGRKNLDMVPLIRAFEQHRAHEYSDQNQCSENGERDRFLSGQSIQQNPAQPGAQQDTGPRYPSPSRALALADIIDQPERYHEHQTGRFDQR